MGAAAVRSFGNLYHDRRGPIPPSWRSLTMRFGPWCWPGWSGPGRYSGRVVKIALPGRYDRLAVGVYIALGWVGVAAIGPAREALPGPSLVLIVLGGGDLCGGGGVLSLACAAVSQCDLASVCRGGGGFAFCGHRAGCQRLRRHADVTAPGAQRRCDWATGQWRLDGAGGEATLSPQNAGSRADMATTPPFAGFEWMIAWRYLRAKRAEGGRVG